MAGHGGVTKHHKWDDVVLTCQSRSHLPLSRRPGRLGIFNLTLHHLTHCQISLLSLAVVVAMFFKVVVGSWVVATAIYCAFVYLLVLGKYIILMYSKYYFNV